MTTEYTVKITDARYYANRLMPYLGRAIFISEVVESPGLKTMAVDKHWRMYYDPSILDEWSLDELSGVVLHEIFHLVLVHHQRFKALCPTENKTNQRLWNIAADMSINSILDQSDITLPEGCVYPDHVPGFPEIAFEGNLSAEEYYKLLNELPNTTQERLVSASSDHLYDGLGSKSSSGSDGEEREWELGEPTEESGLEETTQRRVVRSAVKEMKDVWRRSVGNTPGEIEAIIERILEPRVDPATEIFTSVKYAVNSIHGWGSKTFKRRNPRQPAGALLMPANQQPVPQVRVLIDTSASMTESEDLPLAAGVVAKVLNALPGEGVEVYCADTQVQSVQKVFTANTIQATGRGGTQMEVAIPEVDNKRPNPDVIICITDGETDWPTKETKAKLVICLTRKNHYYSPPEWSKNIYINPN